MSDRQLTSAPPAAGCSQLERLARDCGSVGLVLFGARASRQIAAITAYENVILDEMRDDGRRGMVVQLMDARDLRLAHLRGVLGSITNMASNGPSAVSHARAALAYDGDPVAPDDLRVVLAGILDVLDVAMPKSLQAQDNRVRTTRALLARLDGTGGAQGALRSAAPGDTTDLGWRRWPGSGDSSPTWRRYSYRPLHRRHRESHRDHRAQVQRAAKRVGTRLSSTRKRPAEKEGGA